MNGTKTLERPLCIVKVGTTEALVRARQGSDFETWFAQSIGVEAHETRVVAVFEGQELPDPSDVSGVVVTGSSAMVTDRADWSERTRDWLIATVDSNLPVLAICYGHHLLADAYGGRVDWNPGGREIGTIAVELADAAEHDELLAGLASPLHVQESHGQSVIELPAGAVLLARNEHDPCQGFRLGDRAWGFQFHPEFDADIVRDYVDARREVLASEGFDVEALIAGLVDDPAGATILARFGAFVRHAADTAAR